MKLGYDPRADAAAVLVSGPDVPGRRDALDRLDVDQLIHYDADDCIIEYQFLNVRRYRVRLDDLEHGAELTALFAEAGFHKRDWGHPIPTRVVRRRDPAAS